MARFTAVAVAMLVVLAAGVWLFWYGVGLAVIPAEAQTRMRMFRLAEGVLAFAEAKDRLPVSLSELGPDPVDGKGYATTDLWGRAIGMEISEEGFLVLVSLGEDGRVGGVGAGEDIEERWRLRDARSGGWLPQPVRVYDVGGGLRGSTTRSTTMPTMGP